MSEFRYAPTTLTLRAGETVTVQLKNRGTVEHEFMAGRQPIAGGGYAEDWLKLAKPDHSGDHGAGHAGAGVRVQPRNGSTITLTVPTEKGEYEYGCFVPGHYESGMKGKIVVE